MIVAIKLSDAEFVLMEMLWNKNNQRASELAETAKSQTGWEKNTTYTLIQRLIKKKAVERTDPGFICKALIGERQIKREETHSFLDKMYNGSLNMLVKSFLSEESVSKEDLEELRRLIDQKRGE